MKTNALLVVAVLLGLILAPDAKARAAKIITRNASGDLAEVDLPQRRLVLQSVKLAKPLALVWDKNTRIFLGSDAISASALARGQYVRIGYRQPTFGSDYASTIFIISPGAASKPYPSK